MLNLLEAIRRALDELEPRLSGRIVDTEMPRLFVEAESEPLQRALVAVIGRTVDATTGSVTIRTVKQRVAARVEVSADAASSEAATQEWPPAVVATVDALDGTIGADGPVSWLTVPLAGANAPE